MANRFASELYLSPHKTNRFLRYRNYYLERDLYEVASAVFTYEVLLKNGKAPAVVRIPISHESKFLWDTRSLSYQLEELFRHVLFTSPAIEFVPYSDRGGIKRDVDFPKVHTICLFSGGIDSLCGFEATQRKYGRDVVGGFVAHADQAWTVHTVNRMASELKANVQTIHAPAIGMRGYSQLRGFLYILLAAVLASCCRAKRIVVSECGPTMYQNRLVPFDSVTMTTHPSVLEKAREVIRICMGRELDLILPCEDMTKAEMLATVSRIDLLPHAHSCISQRFGNHDGTCFGCVIRRLAFLAAGLQDTVYVEDPALPGAKHSDGLLALLRFSLDVLTNFPQMDGYMKENIVAYGKQDLFRRFALDNFAAILALSKTRSCLEDSVEHFLKSCLSVVGEDALRARMLEIRKGDHRFAF